MIKARFITPGMLNHNLHIFSTLANPSYQITLKPIPYNFSCSTVLMSRTALDGFPLGDIEKDYMLDLIQRYAALYLVEILGFCLMGNHFHILVRVIPEYKFSDEVFLKRYSNFYGPII